MFSSDCVHHNNINRSYHKIANQAALNIFGDCDGLESVYSVNRDITQEKGVKHWNNIVQKMDYLSVFATFTFTQKIFHDYKIYTEQFLAQLFPNSILKDVCLITPKDIKSYCNLLQEKQIIVKLLIYILIQCRCVVIKNGSQQKCVADGRSLFYTTNCLPKIKI